MTEFDIHHPKRTLESRLRRLSKTKEIGTEDKKLILEFYQDSIARGFLI